MASSIKTTLGHLWLPQMAFIGSLLILTNLAGINVIALLLIPAIWRIQQGHWQFIEPYFASIAVLLLAIASVQQLPTVLLFASAVLLMLQFLTLIMYKNLQTYAQLNAHNWRYFARPLVINSVLLISLSCIALLVLQIKLTIHWSMILILLTIIVLALGSQLIYIIKRTRAMQ